MLEGGGTTTQGGVKFQDAVAALYLGRMLDMRPRKASERPVTVQVEAPDPVDDIVVRFADDHSEWMQAKINIKFSGQPWDKLWQHFAEQRWGGAFQEGDRIVLILGKADKKFDDLQGLCKRAEDHSNIDNWLASLNQEMISIKNKVVNNLNKDDETIKTLFASVDLQIVPIDKIESDYVPNWMPLSGIDQLIFFKLLVANVLLRADRRKRYDPASLLKELDTIDLLKGSLVNAGLTALIQLMQVPGVRTAVGEFRSDFEVATSYLQAINIYKSIHDHLQELDNLNDLLLSAKALLASDNSAWDSIIRCELDIAAAIDNIYQDIQKLSQLDSEAFWIQNLFNAKECLRMASDQSEISHLDKATLILHSVVSTRATRVNERIVVTAELLRLDRISQPLDRIYTKLSTIPLDMNAVQIFKYGIDALPSLSERLQTLIFNHNLMQDIDDELRRIESDLISPKSPITEDIWQMMSVITNRLCVHTDSKWVEELRETYNKIGQSRSKDMIAAKRLFIRYRKQMGRCFRQLNSDLLNLTEELLSIGNNLNILLESLG